MKTIPSNAQGAVPEDTKTFMLGCHLSILNGFVTVGNEALRINANVFQFFMRNPRGSQASPIDKSDVEEFLKLASANNFGPLLAHAPYTMNPCSADKHTRAFALDVMRDDLCRMECLPGNMYNFHPGNHVGQGVDAGITMIAELLNTILTKKQTTTVLLETMSGKGSEIGSTFNGLRRIIDLVKLNDKVGVCLDTCHIFDAGYNIKSNLDVVIAEFDKVIGLNRLKAIHLNDSLNPSGSHKDRHAKIGEGQLGLSTITNVINHPKLRHLPFYLETPNDIDGYREEIKLLRQIRTE